MQLLFRGVGAVLVLVLVWGLTVLSITHVREAAAKSSCGNNLKHIGLALLSFADTHDCYPTATEPNEHLPPEKRFSWFVSVGPYIEATDFYTRLDREKGWDDEENRHLGLLKYPIIQCPGFPLRPPVSTMVSTHYIGIAGLGADAADLPPDNPRAGFFGYEPRLTRVDKGNLTNTLVALETIQIEGSWTAGGTPTVRGLERTATPCLGADRQLAASIAVAPTHCLRMGSVRFLLDSVDSTLLDSMVTITGHKNTEPVGVP